MDLLVLKLILWHTKLWILLQQIIHIPSQYWAQFLFLFLILYVYTRAQTEVFIRSNIIIVSYIQPFDLQHAPCISFGLFLPFIFKFLSHDLYKNDQTFVHQKLYLHSARLVNISLTFWPDLALALKCSSYKFLA